MEKSCSHCGTTSTPCWRRGPTNKPMLCNACGSRWLVKNSLEVCSCTLHGECDWLCFGLGFVKFMVLRYKYEHEMLCFRMQGYWPGSRTVTKGGGVAKVKCPKQPKQHAVSGAKRRGSSPEHQTSSRSEQLPVPPFITDMCLERSTDGKYWRLMACLYHWLWLTSMQTYGAYVAAGWTWRAFTSCPSWRPRLEGCSFSRTHYPCLPHLHLL